MLQFVRRPSLEEIVSRLAALDGLSIRQISRSIFIRESINARGYEFPKSENTVMKLILNFATKIENELKKKIKSKQFNKLSLTFDEWTSLRARRYLNLNLYNSDLEFINLGLILIHGSCDSYKTRELIHQQLNKFGLILKNDIVATTCDGASVNVKFGKESEAEIILCMNHGLHLGVTDILYKKSSRLVEATIETNEFSESDCDIQYDDELKNEEYYEIEYSDISFEVCINSVRNVTQFFKRSPVRNAILQQYVTQTFNVEIGLILDCKTRWNTLLLMIQRFLKLIDCIKKALDDLQKLNMLKDISEIMLKNICDALSPVQVAVEALGRKDATIITAETIITFMLNKIYQLNTEISKSLFNSLKMRVLERRNIKLVSLAKYLKDPNAKIKSLTQPGVSLPYSSKAEMLIFGKRLLERLFQIESEPESLVDSEINVTNVNNDVEMSLNDELNMAIEKECVQKSQEVLNVNTFRKECNFFEATGKRTSNLELLFNALLTVKPTSTDSERTFSVSGNFCNKIRSRLGDESINALVFLKYYFLSKKE